MDQDEPIEEDNYMNQHYLMEENDFNDQDTCTRGSLIEDNSMTDSNPMEQDNSMEE